MKGEGGEHPWTETSDEDFRSAQERHGCYLVGPEG